MYFNRFFLVCLIFLGCAADQDSRTARTFFDDFEKTRFAWYDFWENPEHAGTELQVTLREGANHLLVLEEGLGWGGYSGDGFYARPATE